MEAYTNASPLAQSRRSYSLLTLRLWQIQANEGSTTHELVVFSSYEVMEKAPYMGEVRLTLGQATWKSITKDMVDTLPHGDLDDLSG
jgi:hypothetical protein